MKSERLVVLLSPEEKARVVALAQARDTSVGELVRSALSALDDNTYGGLRDSGARTWPDGFAEGPINHGATIGARADDGEGTMTPMLTVEQMAALDRLADVAMQTMKRANSALDKAFDEVEATKAYFAAKRHGIGRPA